MDGKRSALNFITSTIPTFIVGILNAARAAIFIRYLGSDFNGLYQLCFQFMTYLGVIEAGVETALISNLFRPLHDKKYELISSIVNGARRIWQVMGVIIVAAGVLLGLALPFFIADNQFPALFIFVVFMAIVVRFANSYFWAGPQTVLDADNRVYIINNWRTIQQVASSITAIVLAMLTRNFILVVAAESAVYMVFTVLQYIHAKGYFKWLDYSAPRSYGFARDVMGSSVIRASDAVINNTDNIVVSWLLGLNVVSTMTAYASILGTVTNVFSVSVMQAVQAAYGKLKVSDNTKSLQNNFSLMKVIMLFLGALLVPVLLVVVQPFIALVFTQEVVAGIGFLAAFLFLMYLRIARAPFLTLRVSLGLYNKLFIPAMVNAALNIIISITLTMILHNPIGVICGTIISFLLTEFWYEILLIDVREMGQQWYKYGLAFTLNTLWTAGLGCGFWFIFGRVAVNSLLSWFLMAMVAGICSLIINFTVYMIFSSQFRGLVKLCWQMIGQILGRRKNL